jgi:hypothetical protein
MLWLLGKIILGVAFLITRPPAGAKTTFIELTIERLTDCAIGNSFNLPFVDSLIH